MKINIKLIILVSSFLSAPVYLNADLTGKQKQTLIENIKQVIYLQSQIAKAFQEGDTPNQQNLSLSIKTQTESIIYFARFDQSYVDNELRKYTLSDGSQLTLERIRAMDNTIYQNYIKPTRQPSISTSQQPPQYTQPYRQPIQLPHLAPLPQPSNQQLQQNLPPVQPLPQQPYQPQQQYPTSLLEQQAQLGTQQPTQQPIQLQPPQQQGSRRWIRRFNQNPFKPISNVQASEIPQLVQRAGLDARYNNKDLTSAKQIRDFVRSELMKKIPDLIYQIDNDGIEKEDFVKIVNEILRPYGIDAKTLYVQWLKKEDGEGADWSFIYFSPGGYFAQGSTNRATQAIVL